jgi:hypothetical protein
LFARLIISFSLLTAGAAQLITPATAADPAALEALGKGKDSPSIETEHGRLNRAIALEKQAPAPDAYFLMWTLARRAEILGNKSDPLAVGEEGLGRPGDADSRRVDAIDLKLLDEVRAKPVPKTDGLSSNSFGQRGAELP